MTLYVLGIALLTFHLGMRWERRRITRLTR